VTSISSPITSFPLSTTVRGGLGTVGLTKTVLEVEGMLDGGATYLSPVLSVGLFWIESIWVSFSSVTLSNCSCVSSSFSSRSYILSSSGLPQLMNVLLMNLPQLLKLYIEDFIGLFEFLPVFITLLRVVRILLFFMWSHKG
jgi:hypothetical protein